CAYVLFSCCSTCLNPSSFIFFFFNPPSPSLIYTLSLHDALPIFERLRPEFERLAFPNPKRSSQAHVEADASRTLDTQGASASTRSEEHTSELQSLRHLVCRLLLEKKKKKKKIN